MSGCVFCDIAAGRVEAFTVYDDADALAFLDRSPLRAGHTLLIPRTHVETLGELPVERVGPLFETAQRLALAVEEGMRADGCFVAINIRISQSVPHLHVHVVPRTKGDGLFSKNFMWMRRPYPSQSAAVEAQQAIRAALG